MRDVFIKNPSSSSLQAQLISLYDALKKLPDEDVIRFDFSELKWASPLLILPLSVYLKTRKSSFVDSKDANVSSYLDAINFPDGVDSVSELGANFQKLKNYVPISVLRRDSATARERLESLFGEMIYKILGNPKVEGGKNAVYYPISELVTNIFEHSKRDEGFLFGQFYPKGEYLDICIVDCGRGLAAAYKQEKGLSLSDEDAIAEVMMGHSIKNDKERGYGVRTSKKVVCQGLKGSFVLLSGSAALISSGSQEDLISLPNFYWQGVIIAYRIPKPTSAIDITQYLE